MRHKKKKSSTSTEDEDDIPLKLIKMNGRCDEDPNSYKSLCVPSSQPCELCDRVSKNRYSSLIHNVRHIIIPLLNQTVYQCEICLHHFTSTEDLTRHQSKKHTLSELISQTNLVKGNFNNPEDGTYESDLISIIKKEPLSSPCTQQRRESETVTPQSTNMPNGELTLKSRLMFEEDIITLNCDQLLSDLTTDCQVQVEMFPPIWEMEYSQSVHYDELMKPGVFRCKKCGQRFPSRYEAIIHESSHMIIKNSRIILCKICNKYISGDRSNLLHHKLATHWKPENRQKSEPKDITKKDFGGKHEENGVEEPYTIKTTTMKLCDMCFSFCKNRSLQYYDCIGELSEVGKRYSCEKCGYKFFVVKLVKRETKYKYSSFAKKKNKGNKCMSNETRLKMISNRFKMMKKTYYVVLFIHCLLIRQTLSCLRRTVEISEIIQFSAQCFQLFFP